MDKALLIRILKAVLAILEEKPAIVKTPSKTVNTDVPSVVKKKRFKWLAGSLDAKFEAVNDGGTINFSTKGMDELKAQSFHSFICNSARIFYGEKRWKTRRFKKSEVIKCIVYKKGV